MDCTFISIIKCVKIHEFFLKRIICIFVLYVQNNYNVYNLLLGPHVGCSVTHYYQSIHLSVHLSVPCRLVNDFQKVVESSNLVGIFPVTHIVGGNVFLGET